MPGAIAGRPVRIAGAGPSGLAAAIALARAGLAVEVHEAKEDVGARLFGDLQVIENNSEAEQIPDLLRRVGIETDFCFRPAAVRLTACRRLPVDGFLDVTTARPDTPGCAKLPLVPSIRAGAVNVPP